MTVRTLAKQAVRGALPNTVRRTAAESLRPVGRHLPKGLRNVLLFEGAFTVDFGDLRLRLEYGERWIEHDLFWRGPDAYEPTSLAIWLDAARSARTVIDVGANIGLFALLAKARNPAATVVGFEPLPAFADVFERNCRLNGLDVRVERAAVADAEGTAELLEPPQYGGNRYSTTIVQEHYLRHQPTAPIRHTVAVVSLDAWARRHGLADVDLVKVDAEGSDAAVVEGMRELVARSRPSVLVEVQDDATAARIGRVLRPDEYLYYEIREGARPVPIGDLAQGTTRNRFICTEAEASRLDLPA